MKPLTKEETIVLLKQPNGPARIDFEAAWDALPQLLEQEDLRAAVLAVWVRAARSKSGQERLLAQLPVSAMQDLLKDPLPKVRKNAARLAGLLERTEDAPALLDAFQAESVRMVRPSQILALGALGCADRLLEYQVPEAASPEEEKHAAAEQEALRKVMTAHRPQQKHRVKGLRRGMRAELTTARHLEPALVRELKTVGIQGEMKAPGRVAIELTSYKSLLQVRSWREILFPLLTFQAPQDRWGKIVEKRILPNLVTLLHQVYEGEPPYAYRIELKGNVDRRQTSRQITSALEHKDLVNSTSSYDTELRFEQHGRSTTVYLKLCTLPDPRFSYRTGTVSASIHPANAAAVMDWASPYLKAGASVLDPCCGSGTMLIERARFDTCGSLFGIDIAKEAIRIAENNTEAAGLEAKFIVKDCRQFEVKERFDEVISNLPFGNRVGDHETNLELYEALFQKLPKWLKPGGTAVLYTMEVGLTRDMIKKYRRSMRLLAETRTEAGGLDPGIFIIRMLS